MKPASKLFWIVGWLASMSACGGNAIDLDRPDPPSSSSSAGAADDSAVESTQVGGSMAYLSADDTRIYWVGSVPGLPYGIGSARSCVFDDCPATLTIYGDTLSDIAVAPNDVFFESQLQFTTAPNYAETTIVRCSSSRCNGAPTEFLRDYVLSFKADTEALYWVSQLDVYRCPLTGCGEVPERVAARLPEDTGGGKLLLTEDTVYWGSANSVYSAAKDGSRKAKRVATFDSNASNEFALDERNLYWIDGSSHIVSCPIDHCEDSAPTLLVSTDGSKGNLRVDDRGLYWSEGLPMAYGSVRFCPLSGCAPGTEPQILISERVDDYALDSSHVYWGDFSVESGWTIRRVPKPAP